MGLADGSVGGDGGRRKRKMRAVPLFIENSQTQREDPFFCVDGGRPPIFVIYYWLPSQRLPLPSTTPSAFLALNSTPMSPSHLVSIVR